MTEDLSALTAALPDGRVATDPDVVDAYRYDTSPVRAGRPLAVVHARRTEDVAAALRWAHEHGVPVVPRGAGSGMAGGAAGIDGGLVVSLAGMTQIRELAPADRRITAEAGVITADVDRAAREHGLMYAPDPSSYEISTIGGNVATNAGGLRCVKYGVTKDSVLGLEVVLADGAVLDTGGRTLKQAAGYDLTSLFTGSEGTLGIVTAATLRLRPAPPGHPATLIATFDSLVAAGRAVAAMTAEGLQPSLLELLDRATLRAIDEWKNIGVQPATAAMVLAQADGADAEDVAARMQQVCEKHGADFAAVSADPAESAEMLSYRRIAYRAGERKGDCVTEDVCVPPSRLPEAIELVERVAARRNVTVMTVAHAGDGNLHPLFIYERGLPDVPPEVWAAADEIFRGALDLGGTLTGEHGVGELKQRWLDAEFGPAARSVHRAIKDALDPTGILNPGRAI